MKEEAATDALLRQFLLGRVEDEERQHLESRFITDSLMRDQILAAEQELIDDYLEDCLSAADKEAFLSLYGDTAAKRRKLRIAESIQEWAANQPHTTPSAHEPAMSVWDWLRLRWRLLLTPIAVAAAAAIVVAVVFVNSRTERKKQYLAIQQELVQLNTFSSLREVPSQLFILTLKPGVVRSADPQPELTVMPDLRFVELRLPWMQEGDYPNYEAVVRRSNEDQSYTIPNLRVENEGGKVIRFRLPAHMLTRGNYQIELSGVAADGTKGPLEVYNFTVTL